MSRLMTDRRRSDDGGFSLVEVIVAFAIFAIASAALLPLMVVAAKTASSAKLETQAKNLTQQQLERMRNLAFHVDHQNGDYVDLLDLYYSDLSTAASTLTPSSARSSTPYGDADGQVVAQFVANPAGAGGRPTGPSYRIADLQLDGYPEFSLEIYTQFLRTTRTVAAAGAGYNSQTSGLDAPPTQLVGITVLTTWNDSNGASSLRTYTEMAEDSGGGSRLATQSRATAVRVTGTDASGRALLAQAGVVQADGSVTTGSSATAAAEAARLEQIGVETQLGRTASVSSPPNPSGTAGSSPSDPEFRIGGSLLAPCGWANVGPTRVAEVSATTGTTQPKAPSDGGDDVRAVGAKRVQAGVLVNGSPCGGYSFAVHPDTNPLTGMGVDSSKPMVGLRDTGGSADLANAAAKAAGQVSASGLVTLPIFSSAYAAASAKTIDVLPLSGFANGAIRVTLNSSSLTCVSSATTAGAYDLTVVHPGGTLTRTYSSTSGTPVAALPDPATIPMTVGGVPRTLGDYLSWELATGVNQGDNGVSSFGPVLRVAIKASATGTTTDITIELGVLSCAADDRR